MDGEQTTGIEPELSEVVSPVTPEITPDSHAPTQEHEQEHEVDTNVSMTPVSHTHVEKYYTNIPLQDGEPAEESDTDSDRAQEIIGDVSGELAEASLPSWLAEDLGDELADILPIAIRHVKAKRGGDLLGMIMPAADQHVRGKRKAKLSLIVITKGEAYESQWIRVKRNLIEITFRGQKDLEEELRTSLSLPSLFRKARVLFERDGVASTACDLAAKKIRQGPPYPSINERIHLKAECYHWLGKVQEAADHPDRAQYVLRAFVDQIVLSWFRLRGFWYVSVSEELQFILTRDKALGEGVRDILKERDMTKLNALAQRIATHVLKDVPWPARID